MPLLDLLAGTLDGVFAVDRRQRIAFWNEAAHRILGFEPASVLGRPCHEVLGGTDESGCAVCEKGCAIFSASLRGQLSLTRDVEVHASRENRKWINVTTFLLPSRHRELSLLAHVFRNTGRAKGITLRPERALRVTVARAEPDSFPSALAPLTPAESEILRLLARGATTGAICSRLNIRTTTVRTHVQHIMEKLGVHTRLEAVASGTRNGLLGLATD